MCSTDISDRHYYRVTRHSLSDAYALKSGRGINSLGIVYHLAQDAGVEMKKKGWKKEWNDYKSSAILPSAPSLLTRACEYTNKLEIPNILPFNLTKSDNFADNEDVDGKIASQLNLPPAFKT